MGRIKELLDLDHAPHTVAAALHTAKELIQKHGYDFCDATWAASQLHKVSQDAIEKAYDQDEN